MNRNTFAENLSELTKSTADILSIANAMNQTISGNDSSINVGNDIILPSFSNIVNRVERVENTVAKFTQGKGVVETDDGTYRNITVDSISRPADDITGISTDGTFSIDSNWFFESMQYPRCKISIDLTGKIEPDSDRVLVSRIILDAGEYGIDRETISFIKNSSYGYGEMIGYLESNSISYKEDRDEVRLPLTYERYSGKFQVIGNSLIKDENGISQLWYHLSNVTYDEINENGETINTFTLKNGDILRFKNSTYLIRSINVQEKRVRIEYNVGFETIGNYDTLELYNEPFSEKKIEIGIGIDELDVIYVKGVRERYNLTSSNWSNPVVVETNELILNGTASTKMSEYYSNNVADIGRQIISNAIERRISNADGIIPESPTLNVSDMKVVQINTQLEAALDTERYNEITSEIASVKSNISATRAVIASYKDKMVQEPSAASRDILQNSISVNTEKLNNLTTQFSSMVEELNTLLTEAGAINYTPKYHVRGFFAIPEPRYSRTDGEKAFGKQSIIGFETIYRYIHTDDTGVELNKFSFVNPRTGEIENAVFSDWNLKVSPFLEKKYNNETGEYEWETQMSDGTSIGINQIDIALRQGEKLEIKVRSISEAGYPYNPLKSEWSNSIIISFPETLSSDNSVSNILESVRSDMTSVVLQETLSAAGIYSHLSDGNSKYKHNADNIEYSETVIDSSGNTTVVTMSLADKIRSMSSKSSSAAENSDVAFELELSDSSIYRIKTPSDKFINTMKQYGTTDPSIDSSIKSLYTKILDKSIDLIDKIDTNV